MNAANRTVTRLSTPVEPIPIGTFVPPQVQADREEQIAAWLNIDLELVYQPTFGGHPVLLPIGSDTSRRDVFPELDAEAAWWPLLWMSIDQADRYPSETDDEYAYRILVDSELRGMYDPVDGTWLPAWAVWAATNPGGADEQQDIDAWEDRVDAWLDGGDDDALDNLEPAPLPDGVDPDGPYQHAQLRMDEIEVVIARDAVTWVLNLLEPEPRSVAPSEMWDRLCYAADALAPHSVRWEQWFDTELTQLQPVAEAAIVTGVRDSFDRQAVRLVTSLRRDLSQHDPL